MPSRILRKRRRHQEGHPGRVRLGLGIVVGVSQGDRRYGPPKDVVIFAFPGAYGRVGHRHVQQGQQTGFLQKCPMVLRGEGQGGRVKEVGRRGRGPKRGVECFIRCSSDAGGATHGFHFVKDRRIPCAGQVGGGRLVGTAMVTGSPKASYRRTGDQRRGASAGGVGRHSPGARPPINGGGAGVKPSVLLHAKICAATVWPPRDSAGHRNGVLALGDGCQRGSELRIKQRLLIGIQIDERAISGQNSRGTPGCTRCGCGRDVERRGNAGRYHSPRRRPPPLLLRQPATSLPAR
jgi:hypothetical protein